MTLSRELNDALNLYVRPTSFPVGVIPLPRVEDGPTELLLKAKSPRQDLGQRVTICMAVGMVRRYGWALLVRRDDNVCPLGGIAMGFDASADRFWDGSLFAEYSGRPQEAAARDAEEMCRFEPGRYEALLIAPLHAGAWDPAVTIVYGNSAQVMRLTQAAVAAEGGQLTSRASGALDCSELIVQPLDDGDCRFVLPCNGDRVFGMAQDHEMAFTIPRTRVRQVIDGLAQTHRRGLRYPIPVFMRFDPDMPPAYKKLLAHVRGEGG